MTEGVATSVDDAAQRAAEQARLRKERREAKIKAGGSARLNRITGMGGRVTGDGNDAASNITSLPSAPAATPSHSADPDEVDISEHFPAQKRAVRNVSEPAPGIHEPAISEAQLRQMMLGFEQGSAPGTGDRTPSMEDDPLMKMMSQMMAGGGAGGAGSAGGFPGFPPGASSPFPGFPPMAQQQPAPADPYASLWRILHALVALGLGLYIAVLTPFSGTKVDRERAALSSLPLDDDTEQRKRLFFWTFATAEAVLLTTRFFLDKSRAPPPGILWTVVGYIPEPFKGYIMVALRYGQIFVTVRSDILACIFVLGACAWWRG